MSSLARADDAADQQRQRADRDHDRLRRRVGVEDRVRPGDQVDAGGDHRRGVDERRHRGRALHRVREPGLQRELAGLAGRAEQQQERHGQDHAAAELVDAVEDVGVVDRAEVGEHHEDGDRETGVTDAVHEERLLAGGRRARAQVPEGDQQVGREADALPAEVQHHVVVAEDQQQHRRDEQVEVAEELPAARVVVHVTHRVEVDQGADTRDQQDEHRRQRVEQQTQVDLEVPDADVVAQLQLDAAAVLEPAEREEVGQPQHEGRGDAEHAEPVSPAVGALAEQQQDCRAGQRDARAAARTCPATRSPPCRRLVPQPAP